MLLFPNLLVMIVNWCVGTICQDSWLSGHLKLSFSFFAEMIPRLTFATILFSENKDHDFVSLALLSVSGTQWALNQCLPNQ